MAKTSALSSGGEAIHTRTDGSGVAESQVAVVGIDGSNSVVPADVSNGLLVDVSRVTGGNINDGSTDSGSPVKVGGVYNTTPASLTDLARGNLQLGQRGSVKAQLMAPDSNTPVPSGGGAEANALRVTIATDSSGVLSVDDNGGSLTVDNTTLSVLGSGNEAGALRVTMAADSTGLLSVDDNGGSLTVDVGTALPAGTNNIGDVDVLTLPGSLTGKAEDTASSPADVGIPNLGVRNDTPTVLTDTDGDYTMMATDKYGRTQIAPVRSLPKSIQVSGSLGITTAATWDERAAWLVPANTLFAPKMARCAVTTAATRTLIGAGKRLGTFNPNTNVYTADGSVTGNDFYDRMFYRINVTHSATATNVTATYTDQAGASSTTSALVIVASAAAGDWYEFVLATGDFGVQSVTNITDTAAPTSVTDEIWGFRTLLEDNGPANTPHIAYLGEGLQIPAGETVFILFNAAATTAQVRFASILGDLVAA